MLQQYHWFRSLLCMAVLSMGYTVHVENVTILCDDTVIFQRVIVLFDYQIYTRLQDGTTERNKQSGHGMRWSTLRLLCSAMSDQAAVAKLIHATTGPE